jgi:ribose transport system permease protein
METGAKSAGLSVSDAFYRYGLYIVFALLIGVFGVLNPTFLSQANIVNLLQQSSVACIAGVGMVFVMITGGIDLSIGSIIYLSSALCVMATNAGAGLGVALLIAVGAGAAVGAVNGFIIARLKLVPIIVTLAMMFIVRGVTLTITEIKMQYFMNPVGDFIARYRLLGAVPLIVITMLVVVAAGQFVLKYTAFGRHLYAIGNNRVASMKSGIRVEQRTFLIYLLCGALAGLAGLIGGAQVGGVTTTYGNGMEFLVISACVLGGVSLFGGKGRVFPGAFIGVLIVMSIENGLVMAHANVYLYTVVRGIVIFIAVMIDCLRNRADLR